jgi:hypothetical protein
VLNWPLVSGVLPVLLTVLGGVAMLLVVGRRQRRWWSRVLPLVGLCAVAGVAVTALTVWVMRPFPDPLPAVVWVSLGATLAAVGLAAAQCRRASWRLLAGVAAACVSVAAANQVNQFFGEFPTIRTALGLRQPNQIDLARVSAPEPTLTRPAHQAWSGTWRGPPGMPAAGAVSQVNIPATVSGFHPRLGWAYLPPPTGPPSGHGCRCWCYSVDNPDPPGTGSTGDARPPAWTASPPRTPGWPRWW